MSDQQQTIKAPATVSGVGLHSGQEVNLTFQPAPVGHGYKFRRVDLKGKPTIDANVDYVTEVSRGTTLEQNGVKVSTIEHVLAALVGLELDNILIELDTAEVPIMDGSARMFIEALKKVGVKEQDAERDYLTLTENIRYEDPDNKVELVAMPNDEYQVTVMIDYNSKVLGNQHAHVEHISDFSEEIGGSRTFVFLHELEALLEGDLIKGGDLNNAIVVVDKKIEKDELARLAKVFDSPDIQVKEEGILNNVQLRYQNEPARHKLLDIVGDMALIGKPLKAKLIASRPGHKANIEFARKIKEADNSKPKVSIPKYDPSVPAILTVEGIERLLPHKHPFLLVDKIISLSDNEVVGVKNVTYDEPFFKGHFPGNPVMPGVLQVEALAQTGGIMVLQNVPDPQEYDTYFLKINNCRFKYKVVPGDTILLKMEMTAPEHRGIYAMHGTAYVGNKIVTEADLLAQIVKNEDK